MVLTAGSLPAHMPTLLQIRRCRPCSSIHGALCCSWGRGCERRIVCAAPCRAGTALTHPRPHPSPPSTHHHSHTRPPRLASSLGRDPTSRCHHIQESALGPVRVDCTGTIWQAYRAERSRWPGQSDDVEADVPVLKQFVCEASPSFSMRPHPPTPSPPTPPTQPPTHTSILPRTSHLYNATTNATTNTSTDATTNATTNATTRTKESLPPPPTPSPTQTSITSHISTHHPLSTRARALSGKLFLGRPVSPHFISPPPSSSASSPAPPNHPPNAHAVLKLGIHRAVLPPLLESLL